MEVERLRTKRTENEWLLLIVGRLQHVVAHASEEQAQFQPRRLKVPQQGLGKGTVVASTILGGLISLGRHGNKCVARHVVYPGKACHGRPAARHRERARQPLDERIVAARIQQNDAELLRLSDLAKKQVERQRLVKQVPLAFEHGVRGQQIVCPAYLDAVTGIVDHGHVGLRRLNIKVAQ